MCSGLGPGFGGAEARNNPAVRGYYRLERLERGEQSAPGEEGAGEVVLRSSVYSMVDLGQGALLSRCEL